MQIKIFYEDNHILVVEKPVNIPTQEDETGDMDMLTLLKNDLKERYKKPSNVFLGLVHRLDRPVGGVMAFAKTSKAASRLSAQVRTRIFDKRYLAVVHGIPQNINSTLTHYLLKNSKLNIVQVVKENVNGAKQAILDYEVLKSKENLSLVRVKLHTGRPHQIRAQFATIGHPLWGDQKYGQNLNKSGQQIALWANELSFEHPITKEKLTFKSEPPNAFPWSLFN